MIVKAIYYLLSNDATMAGYVSTRIYPGYADPKAVYPFLTYDIISVTPTPVKAGTSQVDFIRVQINTIAKTYAEVVTIATRIRTVLDGYSGTPTTGYPSIITCMYDGDNDLINEEDAFGRATDFLIKIRKP